MERICNEDCLEKLDALHITKLSASRIQDIDRRSKTHEQNDKDFSASLRAQGCQISIFEPRLETKLKSKGSRRASRVPFQSLWQSHTSNHRFGVWCFEIMDSGSPKPKRSSKKIGQWKDLNSKRKTLAVWISNRRIVGISRRLSLETL